jgi:hypothetical protein
VIVNMHGRTTIKKKLFNLIVSITVGFVQYKFKVLHLLSYSFNVSCFLATFSLYQKGAVFEEPCRRFLFPGFSEYRQNTLIIPQNNY